MAGFSDKHPKVLTVFTLVMINVIAVDSLRTLPIGAEYGFSLVFYYLLAGLVFFIPIALVAAELATTWPARGGLYVWVREAFGTKIAFFAIWLQWIYNVVWYPTILAIMAAAIAYLVNPELANQKIYVLCTILAIFWGATLVNCFGMRVSSAISVFGALFGTLLPMLVIIGLAAYWLFHGETSQIQFDWASFFPDWHHIGNLVLFSNILFGLIGVEMSGVHAEAVQNPQRAYPKAILYSTLIIFSTLTLASLSIAVVIPQAHLSLVSGLIDAFAIFFNAYHAGWMIPLIALFIIIGGISGVSAWVIGPTKGLLVAAEDHALPAVLSHVNRFDAPAPLLILQAIIVTVLSSVFILMDTINASYWMLSALTAQLALMVYVILFAAVIWLRISQPNKPRPFRIPGGLYGVALIGGIGCLTCLFTIGIGFVPPRQFAIGNIVYFESFLLGGIVLFGVIPFWVLHRRLY